MNEEVERVERKKRVQRDESIITHVINTDVELEIHGGERSLISNDPQIFMFSD